MAVFRARKVEITEVYIKADSKGDVLDWLYSHNGSEIRDETDYYDMQYDEFVFNADEQEDEPAIDISCEGGCS